MEKLHADLGSSQYYKPWELRGDEEDTLKRQIEAAEETIRRERDEFDAKSTPTANERNGESESSKARQGEDENMDDDDRRENALPNGSTGDHNGGGKSPSPALASKHEEQKQPPEPGSPPKETETSLSGGHQETNQEPQREQEQVEVPRPVSSKEEDHVGEELEQGREDDVIY